MQSDVIKSFLQSSLVVFSTFSAVGASGCLGDTGPAAFQLAAIEYTPDDTNADKTEQFFAYNSDGQLASVETEVDGNETEEVTYTYADGQLAEYERESKDLQVRIRVLTEIGYTNGVMTTETSTISGDGSYDEEGSVFDVVVDGGGSTKLTLDDAGRVVKREVAFDFELTQDVSSDGINSVEYIDIRDRETVAEYTWNDDGLLTATQEVIEQESESRQDGQETASLSAEQETETNYSYNDGVFSELESEVVTKVGTADSRTEQTLSADFNDEGQLTQTEGMSETDNIETDIELELEYDDEGRIRRIEDQDGNRWDFEYEGTDTLSGGVTIGTSILPAFIDLSGKQVLGAVGNISHLRF